MSARSTYIREVQFRYGIVLPGTQAVPIGITVHLNRDPSGEPALVELPPGGGDDWLCVRYEPGLYWFWHTGGDDQDDEGNRHEGKFNKLIGLADALYPARCEWKDESGGVHVREYFVTVRQLNSWLETLYPSKFKTVGEYTPEGVTFRLALK